MGTLSALAAIVKKELPTITNTIRAAMRDLLAVNLDFLDAVPT